jgi:hypothetical protein
MKRRKPSCHIPSPSGQKRNQTVSRIRHDYPGLLARVSDIDCARLAAFIDGEGTIYINMPKNTYGRAKGPQHRLCVLITNTDPRLMEWLKSTFDGCVYIVRNTKSSNPLAKKVVMHWQVNERLAMHLLDRILPYMLLKRQQAEIGLAFMKLKKTRAETKDQLTDEEFAKRQEMKFAISALNKGGGTLLETIQ